MEHSEVQDTIKSIESQLKLLKKHHGVVDTDDDMANEPDGDVDDAPAKAPRRRGRHSKGMPFFKKGAE